MFAALVVIHGFIHLLGFFKAFNLADISLLTQSISKPLGILWLLAAIIFLTVVVLYLLKSGWWWIPAVLAIILSQTLIISSWVDSQFGTLANILILPVSIVGFATWLFNLKVKQEKKEVLLQSSPQDKTLITEENISNLPSPVQNWLKNSGIVVKEKIRTAYLKQSGLMRLKPNQEKWIKVEAEQYITNNPSFIWKANLSMIPLINVVGRDLYLHGQGSMKIKIASIIPVVNVSNNDKLNQATLQRYLGEIVWFPSAAISPYISWEEIDDLSAKATMTFNDVSGDAVFHFNEKGDLDKFTAQRYYETDESAELKEWIAEVKETNIVNGVRIPTKLEISWVLDTGVFTWYKFEVFDIEYNQDDS